MLVIFMLVGWKFAMRKFCARLESISSLEAHIKAVRYGLIEMGGFVRTKWIGSWRQLSSLYSPRTKTRSLGVLNALMAHPAFVRDRTILKQIQGDEYRGASGSDVNDDILLTTLVKP